MAAKVPPSDLQLSGNYHYSQVTQSYQYVKKTGYLKSRKFGRWRRRWCKLVDLVMPDSTTRTPLRYIRLEYYTMDPSKKESPKMKGLNHVNSRTLE